MKRSSIDKQFLFFLIQNVCIGLVEKVDSSFANNISIDSICVLSSYLVITWTTYSIYSLGAYAFRLTLKNVKLNLILQLLMGCLVGLLVFGLHDTIPRVYSLTNIQNEMFSRCLIIHAISCPILALREYLGNYCEYLCKNKEAATGNIIMYSIMIITDCYTIIFGSKTLEELLFWTGFSSLVYSVYMIKATKILKEKLKFSLSELKYSLKHGLNIVCDRVSGKVATIFFNSYASKLSTLEYSIHSICYSTSTFTENFTNALYTYCVVSAAKGNTIKDKWNICKNAVKRYAIKLIAGAYISSFIIIVIIHGKASLRQSLIWVGIYVTQVFSLLLYESTKGFLTSTGYSKYLRYGGMIGIIVRIPITYIGYKVGMGLAIFALASTLDFLMRGIFFFIMSRRIHRREYEAAIQ